jgi:hypothetical protein
MEPITVIELDQWPEDFLRRNRSVIIPVYERLLYTHVKDIDMSSYIQFRTVEITAEVMVRKGERHLMLFTKDEESALLLESVFLPGQRKELQEAEQQAAARGAANMATLIRHFLK